MAARGGRRATGEPRRAARRSGGARAGWGGPLGGGGVRVVVGWGRSLAGVRSIAHFIYYFCAHDVRVAVLHCKIAK